MDYISILVRKFIVSIWQDILLVILWYKQQKTEHENKNKKVEDIIEMPYHPLTVILLSKKQASINSPISGILGAKTN